MKIKNYKNTPNKISYTACYDCLENEKMKYKVTVYYGNMLYSEHIFSNKNDAINELHRLRGVKYRNSRMYTVEMVEV